MKNKGFTLIELLGVIVIISLLMLIVMPKIINSLKSTSIKVDDLTLKMIYSASELYIDEYPNKFEEINGNKNCITLRDLTGEGYLKSPINVDDIDITDLKSVQVTYNNGFKFEVVDKDDCVVETSGEYDNGTTGGGSSDSGTTGGGSTDNGTTDETETDDGYNPGGDSGSSQGTCTIIEVTGSSDVTHGVAIQTVYWRYTSSYDTYDWYTDIVHSSPGECQTVEICSGALDEYGDPYTYSACATGW